MHNIELFDRWLESNLPTYAKIHGAVGFYYLNRFCTHHQWNLAELTNDQAQDFLASLHLFHSTNQVREIQHALSQFYDWLCQEKERRLFYNPFLDPSINIHVNPTQHTTTPLVYGPTPLGENKQP